MTIETNYNIGDEVWLRLFGNNIKTTIRYIKIGYKGIPTYYCNVYLSIIPFREKELFPTEEKLLKSL